MNNTFERKRKKLNWTGKVISLQLEALCTNSCICGGLANANTDWGWDPLGVGLPGGRGHRQFAGPTLWLNS